MIEVTMVLAINRLQTTDVESFLLQKSDQQLKAKKNDT